METTFDVWVYKTQVYRGRNTTRTTCVGATTTRWTIAEALTPATVAMLSSTPGMPDPKLLRKALYMWGFNTARRDDPGCPADIRAALQWMEANTRQVAALTDPTVIRSVVTAVMSKLDG